MKQKIIHTSVRVYVELIARIEAFLAATLIGVIVASIGLQIFIRVARGKALPWPEELAVILLICSSFMGAGALYKHHAHIAVDYFVRRFISPQKQDAFFKFVWFVSSVAFVALLIGALQGMGHAMKYTSGAAIPLQRGYLRLPVIFMCTTNLFASIVFLLSSPKRT